MRINTFLFVGLTALVVFIDPAFSFAEEASHQATNPDWPKFAAALGIAIAAFGGALGQSRAAAAALEGISRNPGASGQMLTPLILGLALMESLVLFAFLIAYKLVG